MTTTTTTEAANPLDALAAQAESQHSDALPGATSDEAEALGLSNEQTIAGAIGAAREAFCFFTRLESPRRVLDDPTVSQLAALWAPVCEKHGINLGQYLGDYALELAAAIGTFTVVASLRTAVVAELASIQAAKDAKAQADTVDEHEHQA
jgi:hypothetical protein